jgi:hypothetical protein
VSDQERERDYDSVEDVGRKGGAAEAHMASVARPVAEPLAVDIASARWGDIVAGAVIALATMIFLNALGIGFGLALTRAGYGGSLAYWMVAMAAIGLFIGSYLATRAAQVRNIYTGLFYGLTVWALFLLLDVIGVDLFGGLSRFFSASGVNTAGTGTVRGITMASGWWFFVGYLIALAASLFGAASGVTVEETEHRQRGEAHRP